MPKKQEWVEGWKVIKKCNRRSCIEYSLGSYGAAVTYEKNKVAKRPHGCGPLAVFNTRKDARDFAKSFVFDRVASRRVVKCLYKKSKDRWLWIPLTSTYSSSLPDGTIFADAVKCLE